MPLLQFPSVPLPLSSLPPSPPSLSPSLSSLPLPLSLSLPPSPQALHCRLDGVEPVGRGPQSKWSEDVSDDFNELVGYPLYSMSVKETGMPLSVELVDKDTGQSLSDLLVEKKLAEYVI